MSESALVDVVEDLKSNFDKKFGVFSNSLRIGHRLSLNSYK